MHIVVLVKIIHVQLDQAEGIPAALGLRDRHCEPLPTQSPSVADCKCGIWWVTTRIPLGSVLIATPSSSSGVIGPGPVVPAD